MVAPAAFRGGGGESGDLLGSESLCGGDMRQGPGQCQACEVGCYVTSHLVRIIW